MDVAYAGFGHSYTQSQITDKRADASMNLVVDPEVFTHQETYTGIYAPFRNCGNGIETAMTLQDPTTLLMTLSFDQPQSIINRQPIRRTYLVRMLDFNPQDPKGLVITANTINGIYIGNIKTNGATSFLEPTR